MMTVKQYLDTVRNLYKSSTEPLLKGYWLACGLAISELLKTKYQEDNFATSEFEKDVILKINEMEGK